MYYQGKRIKENVPHLPEANGPTGMVKADSTTEKTLRLLAIGESTIAGVGVKEHQEGFTGTLANELSSLFQTNVSWKVYARSGYTAELALKKLMAKITEDKADLIVIGLGANDAFTLNSPKKWRKDISNIIEHLKGKYPDASIAFCNMPPIKEFPAFPFLIKLVIGNLIELLGGELKKIVAGYDNIFYADEVITLKTWMKRYQIAGEESEFFSDGVHPSKLTYQTWAKDFADKISNEEEIRSHLQTRINN